MNARVAFSYSRSRSSKFTGLLFFLRPRRFLSSDGGGAAGGAFMTGQNQAALSGIVQQEGIRGGMADQRRQLQMDELKQYLADKRREEDYQNRVNLEAIRNGGKVN